MNATQCIYSFSFIFLEIHAENSTVTFVYTFCRHSLGERLLYGLQWPLGNEIDLIFG